MTSTPIPLSQGELIRSARGDKTQAEFARVLGCDRSCLSRYEHEALGAPTTVINYCLKAVATAFQRSGGMPLPIGAALKYAREAVAELEKLQMPNAPVRTQTRRAK